MIESNSSNRETTGGARVRLANARLQSKFRLAFPIQSLALYRADDQVNETYSNG